MTTGGETDQRQIPRDWDVLGDAEPDDTAALPADDETAPRPAGPPTLVLFAAAWADGVAVLAVVTAALLALNALGVQRILAALPWAAILSVAWWIFAAAVSVAIRQGTPGMLLAGVHFNGRVTPRRVALVVAAAAASTLLLGLPGLLGEHRSPLALASGRAVETLPAE